MTDVDLARWHLGATIDVVQLLAALVPFVAFTTWRRQLREDGPGAAAALLIVTAWAVGLRLGVEAGPSDMNMRSLPAFAPELTLNWDRGVGATAVFRMMTTPLARSPALIRTFFDMMAVIGAMTIPALYAAARATGLSRTTALAAAAALATTGVHVRFSHGDSPVIVEAFAVWVAVAAVLRPAPSRWSDLGASAALAVAAVQRPEGVFLLPVVGLLVLSVDRGACLRRPAVLAGLAGTVALVALHFAGLVAYNEGLKGEHAGLMWPPALMEHGVWHLLPFHWRYGSPLQAGLFTAGAAWLLWRRQWAWLVVAVALSSFVPAAEWSIAHRDIPVLLRHELRATPANAVLIGAAAAAFGHLVARLRWVAAIALTVAAGWPTLRWASRPATVAQELAWLVDALPQVPPGCTVTAWLPPWDAELKVSYDLTQAIGLPLHWRLIPRDPAPEGCEVWYRVGSCTLINELGEDPCGDFERSHRLETIAERRLYPRPWLLTYYLRAPDVRVGLYRVLGPAPCDTVDGGRACGPVRVQP